MSIMYVQIDRQRLLYYIMSILYVQTDRQRLLYYKNSQFFFQTPPINQSKSKRRYIKLLDVTTFWFCQSIVPF